jgi:hypothetical protein
LFEAELPRTRTIEPPPSVIAFEAELRSKPPALLVLLPTVVTFTVPPVWA